MKYFFLIILTIISINSVAAKDTKKISTNFCEDAINKHFTECYNIDEKHN